MNKLLLKVSVCLVTIVGMSVPCVIARGQVSTASTDYREFLGDPVSVPDRWSPIYHIRYNDGGFTTPRPKIIKKSKGYILNHGGSQALADQFEATALQITSGDPDYYGRIIDQDYSNLVGMYQTCGGAWAQAVQTMDLNRLYILIEPTLFEVNVPGYFAGVAGGYADLSLKLVRVVNIYPSGIVSNPSAAYMVDGSSMVEWELGNELAYQGGYIPSSVDREMGSYSPCH